MTYLKNLFLCIFFLLVSCATHEVVSLPNGNIGFAITCSDNKTHCYKEASDLCPKGYKIFDNASGVTGGGMVGNIFLTDTQYNMLIDCTPKDLELIDL